MFLLPCYGDIVFIEASRNLKVLEVAKNFKTIGAYTESTDLIFKAFKQIIHLVTLYFFRKGLVVSW